MKKIMLVGSALMLLSTSAFATKARLQSLGEDKDGSYYISDYRNIYINPAELNLMGNIAVLEWGKAGSAFGSSTLDADNAPKAQGGVFYTLSNDFKIGAILGDETDVGSLTRILSSNNTTAGSSQTQMLQTADNVLDVFIAGKAAVNWGANFLYTDSRSEVTGARYNQHAYALRLGAFEDKWNAQLLLALGAKSDAPDYAKTPTYKGKLGFRVGAGYNLSSEDKIFTMVERYAWDQSSTEFATRGSGFTKGIIGIGHTQKVADKSTLFAKVSGETIKVKLDAIGSTLTKAEINRLAVPVIIGFEHSATDWLIIRGSVSQNLYGTVKDEGLTSNFGTVTAATIGNGTATAGEAIRYLANARYGSSVSGNGGKKTLPGSTLVNAGATLSFGELAIDGLIGTTGATGTSSSSKGILSVSNLETRVGATYKF